MTDESKLQPPTDAALAVPTAQPSELPPQPEAASAPTTIIPTPMPLPPYSCRHVGQNQFQIHDGYHLVGPVLSPTDSAIVLAWLLAVQAEGEL